MKSTSIRKVGKVGKVAERKKLASTISVQSQTFCFPTNLGWFRLSTAGAEIVEIQIGFKTEKKAKTKTLFELSEQPNPNESRWIDQLKAYTLGEKIDFSRFPIRLDRMTEFRQQVMLCCQSIPYGQTLSYGELAELAGSPNAYRAAGTVMSKNPFPIVVPCHRVLAAGNKLGGFSSPQGVSMKRQLLELENALPGTLFT